MADTRVDYLLIGGGRASANAAQAIRENDPEGSILIVTSENRKPYDRPPLSKNFLEGRPPDAEDVESKGDDFYDKFRVDLIRGSQAQNVDRELKLVTLENGQRYEYGKLLLATGGSPVELKIPGIDRDKVYYLRTVDDAIRIRDAAKGVKSAVMIGAGFIGAEVSATLQGLGVKSTVIGREDRLLAQFLSPASGGWLTRYYREKGVDVRGNSQVSEVTDSGVTLANGDSIDGEMIVVGVGAQLNLGLAKDAGLQLDGTHGVITDSSLRTSDPSIWAAGDIASYDDVNFGKRWHLEHYMNATWQGTHAGKSMTGAADPFKMVPYFYSDIFDLHLLLRGDPQGGAPAKVIGDIESGEFTELYAYDDGTLSKGIVMTRDADLQDKIGDKVADYAVEKRKVADLDASSFK